MATEVRDKQYLADKNYWVQNEIMVTITLAEYRSLVEFNAKYSSELSEAKNDESKARRELKELKEQYSKLRDKYREIASRIKTEDEKSSDDNDDWEW